MPVRARLWAQKEMRVFTLISFCARTAPSVSLGKAFPKPFLSLRSTASAPSPSFFCARWLKSESGNQDGIDTTSLGNQSIHTSSIRRRKSSGVNTFVNIVSNSRRRRSLVSRIRHPLSSAQDSWRASSLSSIPIFAAASH